MDAEMFCDLLRLPDKERPAYIALFNAMDKREQDTEAANIPADITEQRRARAGEAIEPFVSDSGRRTARIMDGSLLDLLLSRGKIASDHYTAGARFYADWYHGGLANSGVMDPAKERVDGGTHKPQSDEQLTALWQFVRAVRAIGRHHADPIISLVCFEETRESYAARRFNYHQRQGARAACDVVLLMALAQLVDHYQGPPRPVRARTRSSHAPDYRPKIAAAGG